MPIYEYRCTSCGRTLELLQGVNDPPPECPDCGSPVEKLFSAPSFQFKGSGWYVTDYAGKKSKADGESKPSATESESASSGKAKGDTSPSAGDAATS